MRKLHEKRWRDKLGLFFVEGEDAVEAATAEPVDLLRAGEDVEPKLLAEVASAPHPPRVVGVYRRSDLPAWEERDATLALWRLADPGNVGTLIRTADAFGAAVVLSDGCADPTSPKALRASAGSIWRVPLGRVGRQSRGTRVALEAHGGEPLARSTCRDASTFLLGAEREGLPRRGRADVERDDPDRRRRVAERRCFGRDCALRQAGARHLAENRAGRHDEHGSPHRTQAGAV